MSTTSSRWRPLIGAVLWIEAAAFLFAALLHTGLRLPLLPAFFHDPRIVGASVVEALCAVVLAASAVLLGTMSRRGWTTRSHG